MAKINGTAIKLYLGSDEIAYGTSAGYSMTMATREVTNKDSNGWSEFLESKKSGKIDFKGIFDNQASFGVSDLFALIDARTPVTAKFGATATGLKRFSADAFVADLSITSEVEGNVEFTCNLQLTGAITEITNP